jgi:O-antigen/teichoic acid export membrane protein
MTSGRLLARNTVLNLLGQLGPLIVAFFAVPVLVAKLGPDRFGVLSLAWVAIGYFSLFDLGLSRALTQAVSAALGGGRPDELPVLTITALAAMALLGFLGGAILAALTPLLVDNVLQVSAELREETVRTFYLLSVSLPFVLATAGLRSLLEAHQEFGAATALRVPYSLFNFLAPLAVLPFSHSLVPVVVTLVVGRMATFVAHAIVCARRFAFLREPAQLDRPVIVRMLRQGGWITVSNIISPLMLYLDRFLIGALVSMAAVAYYATPYDMLMKLLVIPAALLGVLFPAFAATFDRDRAATAILLERAVRLMLLAMFPFVIVLVTFAHEGLTLWLGGDFARFSASVVQWLAAGVFINSIGYIPFSAIQAIGRSDLTAKLHAAELPLYVVAIVLLTREFGVAGVAMAWVLRVGVDTGLLLWLATRRLPELKGSLRAPLLAFATLLIMLVPAALTQRLATKAAFVIVVLTLFTVYGWLQLLRPDERAVLVRWLRLPGSSPAPVA